MKVFLRTLLAANLFGGGAFAGPDLATKADNAPIPAKIDFSRDILPVISSKCFHCHGPDEGHRMAKLRLDVREEAVKDRKGTFAIKPGDLKKSELIARITTKDEDDVMPPVKEKKPLTLREIELFKKWIQQGAPYAEHWAFIKPKLPVVPKVSNVRVVNPIDNFIAAKLKESKLKQSAPADRYTLIRRVAFDLTGLPPTPAAVDAFVNDRSPNAYEKVVDSFFDSPAYGERMARMWLDIARYADSAGYGSDPLRLNIWPYRDWVINAFNRNLSYDQFTLEQLAGDLLPSPTEEQLVATAFHRNTMTNTEGGTDDEEWRVAAVKDRIAVTAQAWMGLTLGCAQCHTHKFDPITQKEYYQMFAVFNQTEDSDKPTEEPTLPLTTREQREQQERLKLQIASLEKTVSTPTAEQLTRLAAWEKGQGKPTSWTTLEPVELHGGKNAKLVKQTDHSVLVTGPLKNTDMLVVKAKSDLKNITAVRLEVLPEEKTGKSTTGLTVNEFKLQTLPLKEGAKKARFVRVELPGPGRMLSLAEVQVFSGGENVARKGQATQSSTNYDGLAQLAIDGNTDGDFFKAKSTTHTKASDDPWWELDLGTEFAVDSVAVWNRTDGGTGTRLVRFKVLALDAARAIVGEQIVSDAPTPDTTVSFGGGRAVKFANATADASRIGNEAEKAIDNDTKTGWSPGALGGKTREAAFETTGKVGEDGGTMLTFSLTPGGAGKAGEDAFARIRISVTTQAKPVRVLPESIRALVVVLPEKRNEKQSADLFAYYRQFDPSLTKPLAELAKLRKELADVKPVMLPVLKELAKDKQRETQILTKGNFLMPGDKVEPGFLKAFNAPPKDTPLNRIGVARYLTSRDNPLTARVAVNRLWAQLFGIGMVETEEDFGTQGQAPTHPELLDWLAGEFMDKGWNTKALLKTIVMSATYQQASTASADAEARDPRNRLLSHYPRRRLDAESVRDQALSLSGLLSSKIGGPSVYPPQPDGLWRAAFNGQRAYPTSTGEDRYRRGLYTFWRRTIPYPSMATFDAPSRENCTVRRLPTNTPLQAFVTLNDPAFVEMAQSLGRRLVREGGANVADRVRYGLKLVLSRPPTDAQVQTLVALYEKELTHFRANADAAKKMSTEPLGPLPAGLDAAEAAAWTVVGNVLLNLDGVLTKG